MKCGCSVVTNACLQSRVILIQNRCDVTSIYGYCKFSINNKLTRCINSSRCCKITNNNSLRTTRCLYVCARILQWASASFFSSLDNFNAEKYTASNWICMPTMFDFSLKCVAAYWLKDDLLCAWGCNRRVRRFATLYVLI